jgi:hypothetical protein
MNDRRRTEVTIKVGEYRSRKFYKLGAKVVDAEILLDQLSRVKGSNDKDRERLEIARGNAMKVCAHVLNEVVVELNGEHLERLHADPEWRKAQAQSIREAIHESVRTRDAEWHKMSEEAEENTSDDNSQT